MSVADELFTVIKAARLVGKLTTPDGTRCRFYCRFIVLMRGTVCRYLLTYLIPRQKRALCLVLPALILWCSAACRADFEWLREILPGKTAPGCIWRLKRETCENRKLPRIFMLSG